MVRGLVEDERLPFADEQRGQGNTLVLPTRQGTSRRVEHGGHTQPIEHRFAAPGVADGVTHGPIR